MESLIYFISLYHHDKLIKSVDTFPNEKELEGELFIIQIVIY